MANLTQKYQALKASLTAETDIKDWNYEGVAPDIDNFLVGSVWPIGVQPGTVGRGELMEFLCVAAIWSDSQENLVTDLSSFTETVSKVYGNQSDNCPTDLGNVASQVTLGPLTIGAPSSSAPSSIGNVRGVWCSVQFTIIIR